MAKRTFDIITALTLLIALLPLAILSAFTLKLTQRQVFYRQTRIGLHGKHLTVYHFKTMCDGQETDDDRRRITTIGRFLRQTGMDQYPELWLVLRGATSIVGPRLISLRDHERWQHLPGWHARYAVKPGIAGLAQVKALRGDWEAKLLWDLEYITKHSFALDLRIIARCAIRVLHGHCDGQKLNGDKIPTWHSDYVSSQGEWQHAQRGSNGRGGVPGPIHGARTPKTGL